ncbi:hypothetical protein LUZ60_008772 [Juncus effusus]|nr:hypothetical protein LUZ60_008772 [Juncus effusus]
MDHLYCQEERLEEFLEEDGRTTTMSSLSVEEREALLYHLSSLSSKETETNPSSHYTTPHSYLISGARAEIVTWVALAVAKHGFNTQTFLLAVNYLDRCFLNGTLQLQADKPWMGKLVSLACLSLAAKVEETRVPLLLDLQLAVVETAEADTTSTNGMNGFVFEAKTVRRMELLVLSALQWRLNPVTALSFVQILFSLLCGENKGANVTARCEASLVSVLADWRWVKYKPSIWAAAALLHALELEETEHIMSLINVSKDQVQECYDIISERITTQNNRKRKNLLYYSVDEYFSPPSSPNAVFNVCFSCESSSSSSNSDSFGSRVSSVTSSPDPFRPFKRACSVSSNNSRSLISGDEESRDPW